MNSALPCVSPCLALGAEKRSCGVVETPATECDRTFRASFQGAALRYVRSRFNKGFIRGKGTVFRARDLFLGTQGQFRPPLVVAYGKTAGIAVK